MAQLHDIVIDCGHPAAVARFWAAALDAYAIAPYDDAELARLRAQGVSGPEDDPTVLIEPKDGGPRVWCQLVPERKRAKNRLHLDLRSADMAAEVSRLVAIGAVVLARHAEHCVLADPEGNEFCLFPHR
ncbi:VOC family protein [Streptomyces sp. RTGN2]|uniref:VOC family protein n=1 Tax=Streptomyces sp. RTGN2 TaxID=3016525 RepID=UPI002553D86C|nr:VOC family protein [Streptomyces sp. RTGN2]